MAIPGYVTLTVSIIACLVCCSSINSESQPKCHGAFDIYFILDKSHSVPDEDFQGEIVNFVENVTNSFISPTLGISFITFSDQAEVLMNLTSDRDKTAQGIHDLRQVHTSGGTHIGEAFKMVNEQIHKSGRQTASVILALTDGDFGDPQKSYKQANKSRALGATVLAVGVANYKEAQLKMIANKPSERYVFTGTSFESLKDMINSIIDYSCIEILSAAPTQVCIGESYTVTLSGNGFNKTDNISKVICSYSFNDTYRRVQTPTEVQSNRLQCPGVILNENSTIILQVSVNNGLTFVSSNVTISSKRCVARTEESGIHISLGLAIVLALLFLLMLSTLLWWFAPLFYKKKPKEKPSAPVPATTANLGHGKGKWPTVDASYYGGGGVGGIAPVRVDWGDKGSTEAGSKLEKAKGAKARTDAEDSGGSVKRSPGLLAIVAAKVSGFFSWISRGYQRVSSYRPRRHGGNCLYSKSESSK